MNHCNFTEDRQRRFSVERSAVVVNVALVRKFQAGQQTQKCGLAGPGRA